MNTVANQIYLHVTSEPQTVFYTADVSETSTEFLYFDITEIPYRVDTSYTKYLYNTANDWVHGCIHILKKKERKKN
jgi:hypothetical protein